MCIISFWSLDVLVFCLLQILRKTQIIVTKIRNHEGQTPFLTILNSKTSHTVAMDLYVICVVALAS